MTTIRDVAEHASVSTTTVSHVVNGTRKVAPRTAARVEAAIKELGYRPNALARSMRRGRTHTVGIVIPDIANPFFGDLARSLEDHMFAAGYSAIICNSDGDPDKEARYLDVLLSKKVDGLLLIAASQSSDGLLQLVEEGPPTIVVDRELGDVAASQVMVANHDGGYLAGQHLLELGHHDIAPRALRPVSIQKAELAEEVRPGVIVIRVDEAKDVGVPQVKRIELFRESSIRSIAENLPNIEPHALRAVRGFHCDTIHKATSVTLFCGVRYILEALALRNGEPRVTQITHFK